MCSGRCLLYRGKAEELMFIPHVEDSVGTLAADSCCSLLPPGPAPDREQKQGERSAGKAGTIVCLKGGIMPCTWGQIHSHVPSLNSWAMLRGDAKVGRAGICRATDPCPTTSEPCILSSTLHRGYPPQVTFTPGQRAPGL